MTIRPPGRVGRRRKSFASAALVALAVMAFAGAPCSGAMAAGKTAAASAAPVPLPRLRPPHTQTPPPPPPPSAAAGTPDAIGSLITADDASEAASTEDSDAPEAGSPPPTPPPPLPSPAPGSGSKPINSVGLKLALDRLAANDPAGASLAVYALPDRIDIKIVNWLIATGGYASVPSSSLAELRAGLADWPSQGLMRVRYEQALAREQPPAADVVKALGGAPPLSDAGTLLLAGAYMDLGRKNDAAALIAPFWRDQDFSADTEKTILQNFATLLAPADHQARMDRELYAENASEALRVSVFLDKNAQALAKAVALVIKGSSKAGKALDALPAAVRRDPLYTYARVQVLRRANQITAAAELLLDSPRDPKALVDPDAWWVERRLVSRALIEQGDAALAYRLAAGHVGESPALRAEAEFHAGWYALEYLRDPKTAGPHFAAIAASSTMPLSVSRAEYWLGRTADMAGDKDTAETHYQRAAAYPTAFYGQLALARLGTTRLRLSQPPPPSADLVQRFNDLELVQVIRHLAAAGADDRADVFYRTLADMLTDPAEVALLADMAAKDGKFQVALQIGKSAAARGLPVDSLAFPTAAIPATATPSIERPVVYAIARQESAFNPAAISSAGARGLLQLMPATAKLVAKAVGLPYSKDRLTSDPAYNATLGAAHLADLVDTFGGSYVMTFAAYNAGASRVAEWVKENGDPRDPKVDVVNWIELIPFTETRNYVQRAMENLQVYRARLGAPALVIDADLKRGATH